MRVRRLLLVLTAAGLLPGCNFHREPPPTTDIDDTAYGDRVRVLASDDFQGRKPGTPGEDKTVSYLIENFHKLGLKPGNGSSYVQQVPLVQITASDATLTVSGAGGSRNLVFGKDMVIWTKRAVPEINVAHSEMVFVGYGIVAPEYSWNDYANLDVHGKTVVVLANDPGYASKDPTVFKGDAMTEYGRDAYKVEEAARQGAAGVLLIHDAAAMGYGWNAVQATWSGAQFELQAADANAGRTAIEGWLQNDAARALFSAAGIDFARTVVAAAHPGFKAVPLRTSRRCDASQHNPQLQFAECAWRSGRAANRMNTCSTPLIGIHWASTRLVPATIYSMARSMTRPALPGCWRSRSPSSAPRSRARTVDRLSGHDGRAARSSGLAVLRGESHSAAARNPGRHQCRHVDRWRPYPRCQHFGVWQQ